MGQVDSKEDAKMKVMVNKLNKVELKDLEAVFNELASKSNEGEAVIKQPTWLNRDKFAEVLGTNEFIIEQLFTAFDKDGNGVIDLQEFVTGMAICLHGSIRKKCELLFKVFNLDGDEGIDPKELSLVLTNSMQCAQTLLRKVSASEGVHHEDDELLDDPTAQALATTTLVDKIVREAFEKCDISNTGKLEINEFANWVHKNPKLVNNIFVMQCPKPAMDGQCNPSFNIEDENNVFEEIKTESESSLLTENHIVAIETESAEQQDSKISSQPKPTTLKDLFSNEPDPSNFFDSIVDGQQLASPVVQTEILQKAESTTALESSGHRRTQSEVLKEKLFDPLTDLHSGSQGDLNNDKKTDTLHVSENYLGAQTASESLYSIALSQDSLNEEKQNASELNVDLDDLTSELDSKLEINVDSPPPLQHSISTTETLVDESESNVALTTSNNNAEEIGVECTESLVVLGIKFEGAQEISGDLIQSTGSATSITNFAESCYWEPTPQTKQLLQYAFEGNMVTDPKLLIQTNIIVENTMHDPVKELVEKYLGEQEASKRSTQNITHESLNESELCKLLENGCWRAAIDFTRKFLEAHKMHRVQLGLANEPQLNPQVLQIWFVRISLLVRLRMFSSAEAEINNFRDFESPDLYYQFYQKIYPGQEGSMVPFSFRLLHAELPQHNGNFNLTLDRLYSLLTKVKSVHGNLLKGLTEAGEKNEHITEKGIQDRIKLWGMRIIRIHYSLANCFLGMKEYLLTVQLLEQIISMEPAREISILSVIGRIYLQLGDCRTAQKYFNRIGNVAADDYKSQSMVTMNTAFTSLTKGLYKEAYQQFLAALNLDQSNLAACNNAAVCLLFMGKVKEASDILETMVCQSPEKSLHEEILLNLTTVYELETSRALQKKHKLLDLVCKHKGDGFNVQCLKLT